MTRFYHGDHVRPSSPATGLPWPSVWRVLHSPSPTAIRLDPIRGDVSETVPAHATLGKNFDPDQFEKVVNVRGAWVAVDDAEDFMTGFDPALFLRGVLAESARAAPTTAIADAVDPWADAVAVADSMVVMIGQAGTHSTQPNPRSFTCLHNIL